MLNQFRICWVLVVTQSRILICKLLIYVFISKTAFIPSLQYLETFQDTEKQSGEDLMKQGERGWSWVVLFWDMGVFFMSFVMLQATIFIFY